LEYGESFEACAVRELEEETALVVDATQAQFEYAVNTVFPEGGHYVTIFMRVDVPQVGISTLLGLFSCVSWLYGYHRVLWMHQKCWTHVG